jgi:hypothetical protein
MQTIQTCMCCPNDFGDEATPDELDIACKGTSVLFLTSPLLLPPSTPPVHMYIPHTSVTPQYHLQGPYPKPTTIIPKSPTTFQRSTHQMSLTFSLLPHLYLRSTGQDSDALGQVRVTLRHPPPLCGYLFMGGLVLGGLVLQFSVYHL